MHRILLVLIAATAFAQQPDDAIFKVRTFHEVAISPDGKHVAWSERDHGIWTADVDGTHQRQLTTGDDAGIVWSPASASPAHVCKQQIFVDVNQIPKSERNVA